MIFKWIIEIEEVFDSDVPYHLQRRRKRLKKTFLFLFIPIFSVIDKRDEE